MEGLAGGSCVERVDDVDNPNIALDGCHKEHRQEEGCDEECCERICFSTFLQRSFAVLFPSKAS